MNRAVLLIITGMWILSTFAQDASQKNKTKMKAPADGNKEIVSESAKTTESSDSSMAQSTKEGTDTAASKDIKMDKIESGDTKVMINAGSPADPEFSNDNTANAQNPLLQKNQEFDDWAPADEEDEEAEEIIDEIEAPVDIVAFRSGRGKILIRWKAVREAVYYQIGVYEKGEFRKADKFPGWETPFSKSTLKNITLGKSYTFSVRAITKDGIVSEWGEDTVVRLRR